MTTSAKLPVQADENMFLTQNYQQAMQGLNAIVAAKPSEASIVMLKPGQLTTVAVQAGQHYKLRKIGNDGVTKQTPDNVIAVRHGDDLHLRYADGSTASFDNFYTVCTSSSVCSVNLANDSSEGITLSGTDVAGPATDDGLLVYAHGDNGVLMAMAQDQPTLLAAIRGLGDAAVLTYLPPESHPGILAVLALGALGGVSSGAAGGSSAVSGVSVAAAALTPIDKISMAADSNTAASSHLSIGDYVAAQVTGVTSANLDAINSALDSAAVTGEKANSQAEVQAIVNAYQAIFNSADGIAGNAAKPGPTSLQYTLIGVTGVTGTPAADFGIYLLNNAVDAKPATGVDTVAEVQALADAAYHVIGAAGGGTPAQIAALTQADLVVLGVTGVTPDNLPAVLTAISVTPDSGVNTVEKIQAVVTAAATNAANALIMIRDAAQNNNATDTTPGLDVYAAAGVSGVNAADLSSINSALDSEAVKGINADTTGEVQSIVNAYNAIRSSADGNPDNTSPALTGTQYTLVGVTGVSGVSAPGNALHLLDSVVDASLVPAVDTVPELQAMANAAADVISGAAGGTLPTLADLTALGITGVNAGNLAAVQAAIAQTPDDGTGIDTRGELQDVVTAAVGAAQIPHISSALSGVTNLDVTSDLVLNADHSVIAGTGYIHITDSGGPGYHGNNITLPGDQKTNNQNIEINAAIASHMVQIVGTGANTHIVINPMWDLDLASNYQISFDTGVFLDAGGSHASVAVAPINFSTVIPGTHVAGTVATEAHASQMMVDATGGLTAGKSWMDIQGIGNNTGPVAQLGDLSGGAYALVMKNYATTPGGTPPTGDSSDGIATHDTNVGVVNFGTNDIVYFDGQANDGSQVYDPRYTSMANGFHLGGLPGQNALIMGLVPSPAQAGSTANILLGLEGNTSNQIYASVVSLPDGTVGWANVWHAGSPAVVMG